MPREKDLDTPADRPRLRRRLATMLCVAVMPAAILSIADGARRYARVVEERDAAFVAAAQQDAQATRDALLEVRAILAATAANPAVAAFDRPVCDAHLREIVAARAVHRLAVVIDKAGAVRCGSRDMPPETTFADDPGFRRMLEDPGFDVEVRAAGRVSGEEVLVAALPVVRDGAVSGVVSLSVSAPALRYFEALAEPEGAPMRAVVDAGGAILLDVSATGAGTWLPRDPSWSAAFFGAEPTVTIAESVDGARRVFGVSPFLDGRAWLVAAAETGALYDEAILRVLPAIVAPVLMLGLAVGVSWVALDRLVVRHLDALARLARAYGRGRLDLKPRVDDAMTAEIASLFASIGKMAAQLADRERALRRGAETNRLLLLEVHHRVRNNLQMIASLLSLQMRRAAEDGGAQAALGRLRDRVHTLALAHERLYEAEALDAVDLGALVGDVARAAASGEGDAPALDLRIGPEPILVGPDLATPLALFVNEAVLDAASRRAAAQDPAPVRVAIDAGDAGALVLSIESSLDAEHPVDPHAARDARDAALGARLMALFARQVRGEIGERHEGRRRIVTLSAPTLRAERA